MKGREKGEKREGGGGKHSEGLTDRSQSSFFFMRIILFWLIFLDLLLCFAGWTELGRTCSNVFSFTYKVKEGSRLRGVAVSHHSPRNW